MGRIFTDFSDYEAALDAAINFAMRNPVCDNATTVIQEEIESRVYDAYTPRFNSRWRYDRGLQDRQNLRADYAPLDHELTITEIASWQHLRGGAYPTTDLGDVIEKKKVYHAPPRPFASFAETRYAQRFEQDLELSIVKDSLL